MVDGLGPQRFDEAEFVDHGRGVRHQLADPGTRLAVLLEFKLRAGQWQARLVAGHAGQALAVANFIGQLLTVELVELGLVIEEVLLGRTTRHEQVDHPLGLGREVGDELLTQFLRTGLRHVARQQRRQSRTTDAGGELGEKVATGDFEHDSAQCNVGIEI